MGRWNASTERPPSVRVLTCDLIFHSFAKNNGIFLCANAKYVSFSSDTVGDGAKMYRLDVLVELNYPAKICNLQSFCFPEMPFFDFGVSKYSLI